VPRRRALTGLLLAATLSGVLVSPAAGPDAGASRRDGPARTDAEPAGPGGGSADRKVMPVGSAFDGLPGDRPNVVVVMADDMREDELRFMPQTRRLLEDEGLRFTNAFAPHPLCCPARASFLTGRYTHRHGVWANRPPYGFSAFDDTSTLATALSEAGYRTGFVGKYLNGYGTGRPPDGSAEDSLRYVPPGWDEWRGAVTGPTGWDHPEAGGVYRYFDTTLSVNGRLRGRPGRYSTTMLGDETLDVLTALSAAPRPFFVWSSFVAPHSGFPVERDDPRVVDRADGRSAPVGTPARPRHVRGLYEHLVVESRGDKTVQDKPFFIARRPPLGQAEREAISAVAQQRAEALHVLDQQVVRIVERLAELNELDDTLVVFVSDNGVLLGEQRVVTAKNLVYDPAIRVPVLLRGPGLAAGSRRDDPFLLIDLVPTLLGVAGAPAWLTTEGVDVLGPAASRDWDRPILLETGPQARWGRTGPGLLSRPAGPSPLRFTQAVRTSRYLYVEHASRERELYDVLADPGEHRNLLGRPGTDRVLVQLADLLERLRTCSGESCRPPLPASLRAG
jgi:N-acetylglucosamine-6-sulfatase